MMPRQKTNQEDRARLLISCPDGPGIVAAVSQFLFQHGANIVQSDQYSSDPGTGLFFIRIEFDLPGLTLKFAAVQDDFARVAEAFAMDWEFRLANLPKRMAILASKEDHCLQELLWQWQSGDLFATIPMVISNHASTQEVVDPFGIPFYHIPVNTETKERAERLQMDLLTDRVDVIVLARYMQILSPMFVERFRHRIINIHHSFLPAFIGNNPYSQAYQRGVKLIGATAHYVTDRLDEGPIIEQDVQRVGHRETVDDLKRIGRTVERVVLARAVKWHLDDKVLVHGNKTIVFT